ncbi:MAG: hypothetical protein KGI49_02150 [Patescibacteria group bacterium]|nr:hypothetical protein [Patescibacteria group bacterium]
MIHTVDSYSWWGPGVFAGLWGIGAIGLILLFAFIVVEIALKGYALWYSAKRDEKWWFVIMLVINTAGILEIIYLLAVAKVWPKKDKSATIGANEIKDAPKA